MYASIDIGTNTVLLLVAEVKNGKPEVLHEEQRIPRLGRGVDQDGRLGRESMERVIDILSEYCELINSRYPGIKAVVTATSAVRDASNREEFLEEVRTSTGLQIRVLSGKEEAEMTYRGAQSMLEGLKGRSALIIDIGGGSTELALGSGHVLYDFYSFDMGAVRFTERFLSGNLPGEEEMVACRRAITQTLKEHMFHPDDSTSAIGVAGTVTSLAYMNIGAGEREYSPGLVQGHQISIERLTHWIEKIRVMNTAELLERYPAVMEGRADVFLAGLIILEQVMRFYDLEVCTVSTGGIRHGAILKKAASG